MFTSQDVENMLRGIARLNTQMGIFAYLIPAAFALVVIYEYIDAIKKPGKQTSARLLATLALIYVYSGFTIASGVEEMGASVAWAGAIALWAIAFILILDIVFHWTEVRLPDQPDLKILSLVLMVAGIFLYPLLEIALGFVMPHMVLFGAECPTTIFLIGLFIGSIPKTNKLLLTIASINALIVGLSVATHGAPFDYLYAFAGLIGLLMLLKYFRLLFRSKSPSPEAG